MSASLNSVASIQFDSAVKQAFQGSSKLKNTVTLRSGVVGDTYKFRAMGKGIATERTTPSADAVPMNIANSLIPCTLTNWEANEYTDIFDAKTVNFSEVKELGQVIAKALGRKCDQLIIDAIEASTPTTVNRAVASSITLADLREIKKTLDAKGVDSMDRVFAINADGLDKLLASTEVTSSDYNSVKTLVNGEIDTFMGFKFIMIEDRVEGGIPADTAYIYQKSAVGMAIGMDITTGADWIPHKKSWLSAGNFKAGSVVRDGDGVVKFTYGI